MNKYLLIIISILVSLGLGLLILPILKKRKIGQNIRDVGPKSHYSKAGTPTMGGIIFMIATLILSLVFLDFNLQNAILIISMLGFGAVGFIDDFRKLVLKQSEGLSPKGKLVLQFALAVIITVMAFINDRDSIELFRIPFTNFDLKLGILGIPLMIFIIVGTTNATNLTDGLDGLLASVSVPVFITLAIIGKDTDSELFSYIMMGTLLGFLFFNSK